MRKTRLSLLIILAMCLSIFPLTIFITNTSADTVTTLPDYQGVDWQSGLAGNVAMPELGEVSKESSSSGLRTSVMAEGDVVYDWYLEALGFDPHMTLRAEREFVQVYVANDLAYPEGDPRNDDPLNLEITDDMCNYLADEFNDVIYATDSGYYGETFDRDGTSALFKLLGWEDYYWNWINVSNGQKVILKVLNIVDDNYYDPTYPSYVAGFFSPTYNGYYDRNMIHIDAWRWWQRIGAEGYQWFPDTNPDLVVTRPNLYESTVAHEYQHNIHGDQLPGDVTYMNEACSLFAEPLCGYELDAGQIEWFLATPDNSLTEWGDQGGINILADYGAAFLWALFLTSHYGFDFMGLYTQGGLVGTEGINALLPRCVDFYDVFHDWRIANLIQTNHGRYGYTSFGFTFDGLEPLRVYDINARQFNWKDASKTFGETMAGTTAPGDLQYSTGIYEVSAFGSDYILLDNIKQLSTFWFDGEDEDPFGWTMTDMGWYSGAADLYNALLYSAPYTVQAGDTLTINTYWDIEDYWDFGFVQVSTDGGNTWESLANEYTTYDHDPDAHPDIIANLPGLTGWSTYTFMDDAYYLFHDISFDLSAYVGQEVIFGFRYMTDWGTVYEGWYISDAHVGTTTLNLTPQYPEIDFMVTVILKTETWRGKASYFIWDMWLKDATEYGFTFLYGNKWIETYIIVSPMLNQGFADYSFALSKIHFGRFGHTCYC